MPLPDGFNSFEHLQDTIGKILRKEVLEEFKDIDTDDLDISLPRSSLRTACLPDDNDTGVMLLMRALLYFVILRKVQDLQPPVYGIPTGTYHETFKFKPQVCLYFYEDLSDVESGYQPIRSQITFRLMGETETSISKTELTTLATKIKNEFGQNNGYRFKRGKTLCTYYDPENGYQLKLFTWEHTDAIDVIKKVLSLTNTAYDASKLNVSRNNNDSQAYPTIPDRKLILGENLRMPRKRPVGWVRFSHSTCSIWGKTKPVTLYSRTKILRDGLVT